MSPATSWRAETLAVTAGRPERPGAPLNTAPTFASTYRYGGEYDYGRFGNPTWSAFETALGILEGGHALAFASGQAALTSILETLPVGSTVLLPDSAYLGTRGYLDDVASRGRLVPRLIDMTDTDLTIDALTDADALWVESPTNPMLGIVDLAAVLRAGTDRGILTVVDNTFATPLLQHPLDLGATAVVHSATKYVGGHSDLLLGATVTRDGDLLQRLHTRRTFHGGIPGPMEAWLALRGLRTLPLRLGRAQDNAIQLARWLHDLPQVIQTRYPGLPDHPGHELAGRQMSGFGAILSLELSDARTADELVGRLQLIVDGTSLGGVETTIDRRNRWPGEERVPPGLLRLSVGIEHVEDLRQDLIQAFG